MYYQRLISGRYLNLSKEVQTTIPHHFFLWQPVLPSTFPESVMAPLLPGTPQEAPWRKVHITLVLPTWSILTILFYSIFFPPIAMIIL
jgi:hypothetical protein